MAEQTPMPSLRQMSVNDLCCVSRTIAWAAEAPAVPPEVKQWALNMCNPILHELKRRQRSGRSEHSTVDEREDE